MGEPLAVASFQDDSADMRLLKWQRSQLGLAEEASKDWSSSVSAELATGLIDHEPPVLRGATLALTLAAAPSKGLIPGAISTISLTICNEGSERSGGALLRCPLPLESAYRQGSLEVDGRARPDQDAEAIFNDGLGLGALESGQRITVLLRLQILPGVEALHIAPTLFAENAAVLGIPGTVLERGAAVGAFSRAVVSADLQTFPATAPAPPAESPAGELPIYELDPEEALEYEAVEAALSPIVETPVPAVVVEERAPEPEAVPPAAPAPAQLPTGPRGRPGERVLVCRIDRGALALLERLFAGKGNLGLLPHFLLQNALACTHDTAGHDRYGIADFTHRQAALLNRGLLQRKLGKIVRAADFPAEFPSQLTSFRSSLDVEGDGLPQKGLFALLGAADGQFFEQAQAGDPAVVFVRARQITTALQARRVAGAAAAIEPQLAQYASAAGSRINRIFVSLKLNKDADVIGKSDDSFDVLARSLIQALQTIPA